MKKINFPLAIGPLVLVGLLAGIANAEHSWGSYHWDISTADSNGAPLILGDNLALSDPNWSNSLVNASSDWNALVDPASINPEPVLYNKVIRPEGGLNTSCDPVAGRIEVCNDAYGTDTGWLGIASIWATRGGSKHITQGVVKLNDFFFDLPLYDSDPWRDFVMCQEVGHTFGLDHQDVDFSNLNLGTCMDYTNAPDGGIIVSNGFDYGDTNVHPNAHDYETLAAIYAHLNPTAGDSDDGDGENGKGGGNGGGKKPKKADAGAEIDLNNPTEWGHAVQQDARGRNSLFERTLPNGQVLITHVFWAF